MKTTPKMKEVSTEIVTESTDPVKEINEVVVVPLTDAEHRIGCLEGKYVPHTYCNKVNYI